MEKVVVTNFEKLIPLMNSGEFVKSVVFTRRQSDKNIAPLKFAATDNCLQWIILQLK
jgi:hypothetical protein